MADQGMSENSSPSEGKAEEETIDIHFDRSPSYEVYHVDGVHGGPSPQGDQLVFDFYVERQPQPQLIRHRIDIEGKKASLGEEVTRGERDGVLREFQSGVTMSWKNVVKLRDWLDEQIQKAEDAGMIEIED